MKIISFIKRSYLKTLGFLMLSSKSLVAYADGSDPFPHIDIQGGDVVKAVGENMEMGMKYALIGGGIIMILVGIGVVMHRLKEDTTNRETGSFLTTLIIAGIAITVGIILLAIGWSAATYNVGS